MIELLIMCGTGIATSTIASEKMQEWLKSQGYQNIVEITQGKISDEISNLDNYDVVISTTEVPASVKDRVILGTSLITDININETYKAVENAIKEKIGD